MNNGESESDKEKTRDNSPAERGEGPLIRLEKLKEIFDGKLSEDFSSEAAARLEALRLEFLGKKGEITKIMKDMAKAAPEERPLIGKVANEFREYVRETLEAMKKSLAAEALQRKLEEETIDITFPGTEPLYGGIHPLVRISREICNIFVGLGYSIAEGPEIELSSYNFSKLNIEESHPSRDPKDTFYIDAERLLRTQTSPVQIRVMEEKRPPIRIICPGRVYRADTPDATHSPIFHQIEGLVVDEGVRMSDLKGTLETFAEAVFGPGSEIRLRPHHFPFTEPSCEVDVTCWVCGGAGDSCSACKGETWVEILGAGMVHPEVLRGCGIDPEVYSGFAFGIGVERTAMGRWGISDIRNFYANDIRFFTQFAENSGLKDRGLSHGDKENKGQREER